MSCYGDRGIIQRHLVSAASDSVVEQSLLTTVASQSLRLLYSVIRNFK